MSVHYRMGSDDGQLPSGFRFRPTDAGVELLTHYLSPKAANTRFVPAAVYEVNLHKSKQWDLLPAGGGGEDGGGYFCRRSVKFLYARGGGRPRGVGKQVGVRPCVQAVGTKPATAMGASTAVRVRGWGGR